MVFGKMATSYSKKGNMLYIPQMEKGKPYTQKSGKQKEEYSNSTVRTPIKQVITENNGERFPRSIQKFASDKEKLHPTQKPVALLEYLIKTYTNENETVLDNCMGSGSTGVACVNTNRNFIGIELDEKYFNIAKERIEKIDNERKENEKI
jgi:site-specific DNA-methyltransferase (adenine-specific)